jgi:hypothetical protein
MTPEQRFTKIENFLATVAEHQAHMGEVHRRHDEEIQELRQLHKGLTVAVGKIAEAQRVVQERLAALIETVDRIIQSKEAEDDR